MSKKHHRPEVPAPAHPEHRNEPLPWHKPNPSGEDSEAPGMLEQIFNSPSYIQPDQDIDFLNLDDTRGVRLQLDYMKPELLLKQHGIEHSVVVFGSTRMVEPASAQQKVDQSREALATTPDDGEIQRCLFIAERMLAKSHYYDIAREFRQRVAHSGSGPEDSRLMVMTGGGPGATEAANRYEANGETP